MRGRCEDCEDTRIGVVVEDTTNYTEAAEVVFIGVVCAVPSCDVEGCVVLLACVQLPCEFRHDGPFRGCANCCTLLNASFEMRRGDLEIPRVG